MINDFNHVYGFPTKKINDRIILQPLNDRIDPFMVFLNSNLEEKEEGVDKVISIEDINLYFKLYDEGKENVREILDECA